MVRTTAVTNEAGTTTHIVSSIKSATACHGLVPDVSQLRMNSTGRPTIAHPIGTQSWKNLIHRTSGSESVKALMAPSIPPIGSLL
jgi:hypothetical protein